MATHTVFLTFNDGRFTARCGAIVGASATSRREALGQLCDAHGAQGSWLNLGDAIVLGPTPMVGMPATYSIGSDCYAYTVTKLVSPTRIELTRDRESHGLYLPADAESGKTILASRRSDGRWRAIGTSRAGSFELGERETKLDPDF